MGEKEGPNSWRSSLTAPRPWWGSDKASDGENNKDDAEFRFMGGPLRWMIDRGPRIIIATTVVLFAVAEFTSPSIEGIHALLLGVGFIVPVQTVSVPLFLGMVAWVLLLVSIILHTDVVSLWRLVQGSILIIISAGLILGTLTSLLLVITSDNPRALRPNIVFVSGYLLMLLWMGRYIRSSMAYTESLINSLNAKVHHPTQGEPSDNNTEANQNSEPYSDFIDDLNRDLRDKLVGQIPSAYAFGFILIIPFGITWWFGSGPQNLGAPASSPAAFLTYSLNLTVDFVIAVIAFKFIILVRYMHELTNGSDSIGDAGNLVLIYDPQHPDECAGLSDIGNFAMKVNLLLIGGLVYLVYRVYTQGLRVLPQDTIFEQGTAIPTNWLFSYVGPIFIFTVVSSIWLYYSFWGLHKKMLADRRRLIEEWPDYSAADVAHIRLDDRDRRDALQAPVWPIDNRQLVPLLLANIAPALVMVIEGAQLI